jgi:hypothetical protein
VTLYNHWDAWFLDASLASEKWNYRASGGEIFLASISLVSAITRSATNVEMYHFHFDVSYIIKYTAGNKEHQPIDVATALDRLIPVQDVTCRRRAVTSLVR